MSRGKWQQLTKLSLLTLSLSMTASCGSSLQVPINTILGAPSSGHLSEKEKAEIQATIQASRPRFPYPSPEALKALRDLNNPAVNQWIQELTVLCRQLNKECEDAR